MKYVVGMPHGVYFYLTDKQHSAMFLRERMHMMYSAKFIYDLDKNKTLKSRYSSGDQEEWYLNAKTSPMSTLLETYWWELTPNLKSNNIALDLKLAEQIVIKKLIPDCDCGAVKAKTTHSDWCSTKELMK